MVGLKTRTSKMAKLNTTSNRGVQSYPRNGYDPKQSFNRGTIAQTGFIPEGAQLLQDTWPLQILDIEKKAITENAALLGTKNPIMRVTGLFQLGDMQNANGRVYQTPILAEAVQAIQEDVRGRAVWGEFDHPPDAKIHLDRISHLLTKIWMEGDKVYGEAEIVKDLPYGQQLATLLEHGTIGISSRGIGDMEVMEENGQEVFYVTPGYRFVTWDAVAEPSVHGAILNITEGKLQPMRSSNKKRATAAEVATKQLNESILVNEFSKHLKS